MLRNNGVFRDCTTQQFYHGMSWHFAALIKACKIRMEEIQER